MELLQIIQNGTNGLKQTGLLLDLIRKLLSQKTSWFDITLQLHGELFFQSIKHPDLDGGELDIAMPFSAETSYTVTARNFEDCRKISSCISEQLRRQLKDHYGDLLIIKSVRCSITFRIGMILSREYTIS